MNTRYSNEGNSFIKKNITREMRMREEAAAEKATTFFMELFNLVQGGVEVAEGRVALHLCTVCSQPVTRERA
jgi:hypothetical protein